MESDTGIDEIEFTHLRAIVFGEIALNIPNIVRMFGIEHVKLPFSTTCYTNIIIFRDVN